MKKTIGIIGAGNIGKTVATHLLKSGYPVIISNSKSPDIFKRNHCTIRKWCKSSYCD